jgi:hypothetical protein
MKNFMPNFSEKSSTCFTFARRPHKHRSGLTLSGKLASFIFAGLNLLSKQGTLIVTKFFF